MMGVHALVDKNGVVQQGDSSMTVTVTSAPQDIPEANSSPRRKSRKQQYAVCRKWENARNDRKGTGIRHTRRAEDLNQLLCLVQDLDLEEVDIVEPTTSAFTALFMEHDKMKVWNDFLNRPEEAQQQILQNGLTDDDQPEDDDTDGFEKLDEDECSKEKEVDGRQEYPAFSAAECFSRIDSRLKSFLSKSHVPLGTLEHLERDLMAFFNDCPTSVLVTKLGNSFERLLLHALCQYLDLSSRSFDADSGGRHTQIENKQQQFTPPSMTLTEYLEQSV